MIRQKRDTEKRNGFTLVELLVVIVILSMLAGITAPRIFEQIDKSRYDLTKTKMGPIKSAIDTYYLNCRDLPQSLDDLVYNPGIAGWSGPYLKAEQLIDPWDYKYDYVINPDGYDIISYGKDGVSGGEGYNEDQYNN